MHLVSRPRVINHPYLTVRIAEDADLTMHVYDVQSWSDLDDVHNDRKAVPVTSKQSRVKRQRRFFVRKSAIAEPSFSAWWYQQYTNNAKHGPSRPSEVLVEVENVDALEILLCAAHKIESSELLKVRMRTIWSIMAVGDKFGIHLECVRGFFKKWYELPAQQRRLKSTDLEQRAVYAEQMIHPAEWFENAQAFMWASYNLIYYARGWDHKNRPKLGIPIRRSAMNSDLRRRLDGARADVFTNLERRLYGCCLPLRSSSVPRCCKDAVHAFDATLIEKCRAWPFVDAKPGKSVHDLLERLKQFSMPPIVDGCTRCTRDYKAEIDKILAEIPQHTQGLCLNCAEDSKEQTDWYFERGESRQFDLGCRTEHGEATWYHSWVGDFAVQKTRMEKVRREWRREFYI